MTDAPAQRPAVLVFTQTVLALQALVALFATLVLYGLNRAGEIDVSPQLITAGGSALVVALAYVAGKQRTRWGRIAGWVLQVPLLVAGVLEVMIAVLGGIFLMLWITGLWLGTKIDRERAERAQGEASDGP